MSWLTLTKSLWNLFMFAEYSVVIRYFKTSPTTEINFSS
jgi:hypothetical protein